MTFMCGSSPAALSPCFIFIVYLRAVPSSTAARPENELAQDYGAAESARGGPGSSFPSSSSWSCSSGDRGSTSACQRVPRKRSRHLRHGQTVDVEVPASRRPARDQLRCTFRSIAPSASRWPSEDVIHSLFFPGLPREVRRAAEPLQDHVVPGHEDGPLPHLLRRILRHAALGDDRLGGSDGTDRLSEMAAAAGVTQVLRPLVAPSVTPPFILAVAIAALFGGIGPGALATLLSALALNYWFFPAHRPRQPRRSRPPDPLRCGGPRHHPDRGVRSRASAAHRRGGHGRANACAGWLTSWPLRRRRRPARFARASPRRGRCRRR